MGDNSVVGSGTTVSQDLGGGAVEFGVGGTMAFSDNISLYGEVDYTVPFDNGVEGLQALAGLRYTFASPPPPPPAPVIAPIAETGFIVFFDWDRADLTAEANLVLDDVVVVANQTGTASIRLDGYTDLSGSAAYNLGLSERRANSVANGLIARGIAPDEIVIRAFGEENPLVPTPDGVREPQNRRARRVQVGAGDDVLVVSFVPEKPPQRRQHVERPRETPELRERGRHDIKAGGGVGHEPDAVRTRLGVAAFVTVAAPDGEQSRGRGGFF